ncbi:hypothetical protein L873DRAFT_1805147 [Choiromyces venosus 120613-1]|uniref:Uncharacterized protein n=1 Tax=Choiromyces venosus 120613-1 TaxID=1336337 RepID=A0A3N4JPX8_9PEZI|nr:hypothetical protein L873DRAFT_1805147 [Choiromyces venosus 120613-1]
MSDSYESLLRKNRWLQEKLEEAEKKLEKWVRGVNQFVPLSPCSPSPEMERGKGESLSRNLARKRELENSTPEFLEEKARGES